MVLSFASGFFVSPNLMKPASCQFLLSLLLSRDNDRRGLEFDGMFLLWFGDFSQKGLG